VVSGEVQNLPILWQPGVNRVWTRNESCANCEVRSFASLSRLGAVEAGLATRKQG